MRTTVTLEDDVFLIARQIAATDRISLGQALSRLARAGYWANAQPPQHDIPLKSRYSVLPARGEIVTTAHVRRLMDEEGI